MHRTFAAPIHSKLATSFGLVALALACATLCSAQSTIRVRLVDGKSGQALSPATVRVQPNSSETPAYVITKDDPAVVQVTLRFASSISISDQFKPCGSAKADAPAPQYTVQDILDHGAVSPNSCGKSQAQPTKGELVLYVRHATWCENVANHIHGVNFCY